MEASVSSLPGASGNGVAAAIPKKRVTYILPPPSSSHPPPRLYLPSTVGAGRHPARQGKGSSSPLIVRHQDQPSRTTGQDTRDGPQHPRHALPVTSLAIDPSTSILEGSSSRPRGILYTAGRDGLTASWQLGLQMKKRHPRSGHPRRSSWSFGAAMSGGYRGIEQDDEMDYNDPDDDDEDGEDERVFGGDRAADERLTRHRGDGIPEDDDDTPRGWDLLPFERQWQVDEHWLESQDESEDNEHIRPPRTSFRSCVQSHTDWINDMVLCNQNQSVVTASSDRFVRVWNPHDPSTCLAPSVLGSHSDYVKALAYPSPSSSYSSQSASWIASGGLDQRVRIWDLKESRRDPIVDIHDSASVYCLSTDSRGAIIAVGTPEAGIRLYDPRADSQASGPAGLLLGHADMIRSVVLSASGRHLLSGSSDGTVRLWDVAEQRLVHTYTHHASSISALYSSAEDLDVFYSADRDGYLCKVDCEGCLEPDQGECVVLARCSDTISKIAAIDHAFVFTSTGNTSDVQCWRDVPPRVKRQAKYPTNEGRRSTAAWPPSTSADAAPAQLTHRRGWTTFGGAGMVGTPPTTFSSSPPDSALAPSSPPLCQEGASHQIRAPLQSALKGNQSQGNPPPGSAGLQAPPFSSTHSRVSFSLDRQIDSVQATTAAMPEALPEGRRDDFTSVRRSSAMSASSSLLPQPLVAGVKPSSTLFGVPFTALVCLSGDDDDAFAALSTGVGTGLPHSASRPGMNSMLSLRGSTLHLTSSRDGSGRRGSSFSLGGRNSFAYDGHAGLTPAMAAVARLAQTRMSTVKAQTQGMTIGGTGHQTTRTKPTSVKSGKASSRFTPGRTDSSLLQSMEATSGETMDADASAEMSDEDNVEDESAMARRAYESREVVSTALPLRNRPASIILGTRGLIRSSMLNDRRHVLTFATGSKTVNGNGEEDYGPQIAIWDIVRCICLGSFASTDVLALSTQGDNAGDLLEKVKERIEGRGATNSWCTADTKNGFLAVHLDWPSCFEAESYLDEYDWVERNDYLKDDQRVNLGKWVLRSLFSGFIEREVRVRNAPSAVLPTGVLALEKSEALTEQPFRLNLGAKRGRASNEAASATAHLNDHAEGSWSNLSSNLRSPRTPGNTLSIAVAPSTPAVGPAGTSPLTPSLSASFPSMVGLAGSLAATPGGTGSARSPASPSDYFSMTGDGRRTATPSRPATPPNIDSSSLVGAGSTTPGGGASTPGGGLIGRWGAKLRVKGSQPPNDKANSAQTKGGLASDTLNMTSTSGPNGGPDLLGKSDPPAVALNRSILAKVPLEPMSVLESPLMRLDDETSQSGGSIPPTDTAVIISAASSDAAQWETLYRGLLSSTADDLPTLEMASPAWLLDFLLANRVDASSSQTVSRPGAPGGKMSFLLWPAVKPATLDGGHTLPRPVGELQEDDDSWEILPALPSGDAKLTATKMLRVSRAAIYLCEKLGYVDQQGKTHFRQGSIFGGSRRPSTDASGAATPSAGAGGAPFSRGHGSALSMTKLESALSPPPGSPSTRAEFVAQTESPFRGPEGSHASTVQPPVPEEIELLCNGVVLHPDTTLAQVARFYWKGPGSEPKVEYRLRRLRGEDA
ncbi:hypothetical protein BCV69DRAFT_177326 [Microstroma glucosiphilum]|uniref:Uncharacterized protein n=1 Tax=Pseudomicrostroma glucosiphilum TaxID=1684307 RepID=A0A316U910_9BASI|nr:hypothetical protein BCV69DRAFT_177326 [Pseudomicrostroma glucosiphilum]PWN20863.1 hypothetical protein BCV69DRAFT_177326 [Pseudomicrostroma glucosiphilum]